MPATAQLRSANAVLNWYNDQDQSAWKIYRFTVAPKNCTDQYNGNSKEDGYERLQTALSYITADDYENYVISVFSNKDKDLKNSISKVFVINERPAGMAVMAGYTGISPQQHEINTQILNELRALREDRISEIDEDEDESPDDSIVAGNPVMNNVKQILEVVNTPIVMGLIAKFLPEIAQHIPPVPSEPVQAVAGTVSAEDLQATLETLFSKGVTPEDLQKLAGLPKMQIGMLLGMLRKM